IDNIDADVVPDDRGRLGEDGDAALAFEIVGIHGTFGDALILAERAGLLQQPVDQRGLAVVDVGDDGDVTELHSSGSKKPWRAEAGPRSRSALWAMAGDIGEAAPAGNANAALMQNGAP